MRWKKLLFNWRVILLLIFIISSFASIYANGITYGLDISGGTAITVKLEKPVDSTTMDKVVNSLTNRINRLGVADVKVEPWGNEYIIVKVANVSAETVAGIKDTIEKQGVFYATFNGEVFATGEDIVQVFAFQVEQSGTWHVPFQLSQSAAEKFARLALGKPNYPVDMFLDPPVNSLLVVSPDLYNTMLTKFNTPAPDALSLPERIKNAFNIDTLIYTNQTPDEIVKAAEGKELVVLVDVNGGLEKYLEEKNLNVRVVERGKGETDEELVVRTLGLYGPYSVSEGLTTGQASTNVEIKGSSPNMYLAQQEASVIAVVLASGSLPIKVHVEGTQFISAELGKDFKRQVLIAGIAALLMVGAIVYAHYRRFKIAIPVVSTSLSEIIIILGVAALIKWNLDLPSIAGIIAAIGTGVDQQIVITDELLGSREKTRITKRSGMLKRMGRAFFVILASATTTVVAMSFLFKFFVGGLRGFAFTTILGVLIGITITRPAYAEIAKFLLGEKR
ncbi:MAG: preprotein translocase subunit SecD [Palaeococcus sp.]|uniref:preprotein translocase subunit SecD n=1 Tax=Palaeococcus sp. (in: euryarchaeotes) TaxID=2820298 RepID=UPI0025D701C2|nr:preprotein translocase subunit SecD [Palaeococcus sp. (in: euryarchaeotes)]MCD6560125.1 preprotein translocase subunit SecD [Palaeococcus sp. (in: euryarchaeotes)]